MTADPRSKLATVADEPYAIRTPNHALFNRRSLEWKKKPICIYCYSKAILLSFPRYWPRNKHQTACDAEDNFHRRLQFVTWGVQRRRPSDFKRYHKMTSGDLLTTERLVSYGVWFQIEITLKRITFRYLKLSAAYFLNF